MYQSVRLRGRVVYWSWCIDFINDDCITSTLMYCRSSVALFTCASQRLPKGRGMHGGRGGRVETTRQRWSKEESEIGSFIRAWCRQEDVLFCASFPFQIFRYLSHGCTYAYIGMACGGGTVKGRRFGIWNTNVAPLLVKTSLRTSLTDMIYVRSRSHSYRVTLCSPPHHPPLRAASSSFSSSSSSSPF